jgi:hypothetical protein
MNADDAPWEPPELALRVGDRVALRMGECDWDAAPWARLARDGMLGTVIALATDEPFRLPPHCRLTGKTPAQALAMGHPYAVEWDDIPYWGWAARSELRRLAAPDPRAGDGDTQEP